MIIKKIRKDQLEARKNKEPSGVLTALISEISAVGKTNNREATDQEAIKVITKFAKGVKETLGLNISPEKRNSLEQELELYMNYLPEQMTEKEIIQAIGLFLGDRSDTNMGEVMRHFKETYTNYDGGTVSKLVREIL